MTHYVTTQGPIPEGVPITAGTAYEVVFWDRFGLDAILDDGKKHCLLYTECAWLDKKADWTFCDQHGNPVAAPWESECSECGGNGAGGEHEEDCRMIPNIDYRAHAERLVEALQAIVDDSNSNSVQMAHLKPAMAALDAYNKDKGV